MKTQRKVKNNAKSDGAVLCSPMEGGVAAIESGYPRYH